MVVTDELHTSAQLRQTQQALAASQADLSRAERERDEARHCWSHAEFQLTTATARIAALTDDLARVTAERDEARTDFRIARTALFVVGAERDWAREVVGMLRENEVIRAQVIRERNAERDLMRAELASVEGERDGVREELARQAEANEDLTGTLAMRTGQLTTARRHVNAAHEAEDAALERAGRYRHERDLARAELASATAELEQLRAQLPTSLHTEEPPA